MDELIGQVVRGFEIRELIGSGGFGKVYRASQPSVGREVAVKVILPEHANRAEFVDRFDAEARTVAKLEHPHIVPLYDYWQDGDGAYLVMRYLKGGSLRDKLDREGAQDPEAVEYLLGQVCDALQFAHERDVIHRDLKPENILLDEQGQAYLTDFGIAKDLAADHQTTSDSFMGSLAYISPEQVMAAPVSPAADIYALGLLLYELLTGLHPFSNLTPIQLLQHQLESPLPLVAEDQPAVPPQYDRVIQQATIKDPDKRVLDAASFARALSRAFETVPKPESKSLPAFFDADIPAPQAEGEVFIGRRLELDRLRELLNKSMGIRGQVAFVTGGPGRGKTTLVSEFARQTRIEHPDLIVAGGSANAFSGLGDPYLPFRDILSMLTGDIEDKWSAGQIDTGHAQTLWNLFPDSISAILNHGEDLLNIFIDAKELAGRAARVDISREALNELEELAQRPAADSHTIQQAQLFEQYTNVVKDLAGNRPLLLLLDDLQWADGASISLLFHLGRRLDNAPVFVLGTYRGEEVALGRAGERHPLEKVLTEFRQVFGEVRLDLSDENDRDGRSFIDELLDAEPNDLSVSFRESLFSRTAGHPLFTKELLRSMQEAGDLILDGEGRWIAGGSLDWDRLPGRVEAVIEERVSRLENELRELLTVASVEGEIFTAEVIAQIQQTPFRLLLRQLSQDLERRHHLILERGDARAGSRIFSQYRFGHQLFQRYLYNELSAAERRLLHHEVAETLEKLYEGHRDKITVQLARHYQEAGDSGRASAYFTRAGQMARRLFANPEALEHYNQALQLSEEGHELYYEVLSERASVNTYLFRGEEAVRDYEQLLIQARNIRNQGKELDALLGLGRGQYIISLDHPEEGAHRESLRYYEDAFKLAKEIGDKRGMVLALVPTVWFGDFWPEYEQQARENAQQALSISQEDGDEMLILESELAMFYTDPLANRAERGAYLLKKLEEIGHLERLNYLLFGLMFSTQLFGEFEQSVEYCDKGIALAKKMGVNPVQYPTIKAISLTRLGRFDEAWASLQDEIADESHLLAKAFKDLGTGIYYLELRAFRESAEILIKAMSQAEQLDRAWMQESIHTFLVRCAGEGELVNEIDLDKSLDYLERSESPLAAVGLGYYAFKSDDIQNTKIEIDRAKERAAKAGRRPDTVLAFELEAQLYLRLGEYDLAKDSASAGLEIAEVTKYRPSIWRLRGIIASCLDKLGQAEMAKEERLKAAEIIRYLADNVSDVEMKETFITSDAVHKIFQALGNGG